MNALTRFFSLGMQDADRRIAALLEPVSLEQADRYLAGSTAVRAVDRVTRRLEQWWFASEASRSLNSMRETYADAPAAARNQAIAFLLLTAVVVHVVLTVANGARPGWFWLVIPAMAAILAALLLVGSRTSHSAD